MQAPVGKVPWRLLLSKPAVWALVRALLLLACCCCVAAAAAAAAGRCLCAQPAAAHTLQPAYVQCTCASSLGWYAGDSHKQRSELHVCADFCTRSAQLQPLHPADLDAHLLLPGTPFVCSIWQLVGEHWSSIAHHLTALASCSCLSLCLGQGPSAVAVSACLVSQLSGSGAGPESGQVWAVLSAALDHDGHLLQPGGAAGRHAHPARRVCHARAQGHADGVLLCYCNCLALNTSMQRMAPASCISVCWTAAVPCSPACWSTSLAPSTCLEWPARSAVA